MISKNVERNRFSRTEAPRKSIFSKLELINITINIDKSENEIMINSEIMKRYWVKSLSIRSYCSPYFPAFGLDT